MMSLQTLTLMNWSVDEQGATVYATGGDCSGARSCTVVGDTLSHALVNGSLGAHGDDSDEASSSE